MKQEIRDLMRQDIPLFAEKIRSFDAGEIELKAFKGFSGGFGSYPQRTGGYMLRLRMAGGRLTQNRLAFLAQSAADYSIDRMKLTTCQAVQLHNLSAQSTIELMEKAIGADIITRGGGGDFPRNVMADPLSGIDPEEYFDVLPWAEAAGEHLLGRVREVRLPRKLKVCFSNTPKNVPHATFRDLGFAARPDGTFDVYCAGGLGPNPKLGVQVAEGIAPQDILAYIDAMIAVFSQYGNFENRARSRTRYLQDTLGADGLKTAFAAALAETLTTSPRLTIEPTVITKTGTGTLDHPRALPQKQDGLYAVSYHPKGGNLPPEKPAELLAVIAGMEAVECRIAPDGTLYIINLTADEAQRVLEVTADGAVTPFGCSVSCIGGTICATGIRDSQGLLMSMLEAVEAADLPADALPTVHVSGCPSSCGTHQIGMLGFVGAAKLIDGKPQPAFNLLLRGNDKQGAEKFGEVIGAMLIESVPQFIVALGQTVAASGLDFDRWLNENEDAFRALAAQYI